MKVHAYNENYLHWVMRNLAAFFDIAINAEQIAPNEIAELFAKSQVAIGIERAHPNYLCGKSASELLSEVIGRRTQYTVVPMDRSPEYWAGWVLAYTQWYLDIPFSEIFSVIKMDTIISLYHPYHEAAEIKTAEIIENLFPKESTLRRYRTLRRLSQAELSKISGVKLRSIQCYEQGDINIENAQAGTLYALARALDCTIEELLRPIGSDTYDFSEEILSDLLAEGYSGRSLLDEFRARKAKLRAAVETLIADADAAARGEGVFYSLEDVLNEDDNI